MSYQRAWLSTTESYSASQVRSSSGLLDVHSSPACGRWPLQGLIGLACMQTSQLVRLRMYGADLAANKVSCCTSSEQWVCKLSARSRQRTKRLASDL